MMGSGGMIVMDEDALHLHGGRGQIFRSRFSTDESCGKCVPYRRGLRQYPDF